jgi:hypothetical protein
MQPLTVPKRDQKRSRVFLVAEVDCGRGPIVAHIRDISRSGALVEANPAPEPRTVVRLTCGDTTVEGRVAWSEDKHFGVEFSTPLLMGDLMDATGAKLKVSAPRTYRSCDIRD